MGFTNVNLSPPGGIAGWGGRLVHGKSELISILLVVSTFLRLRLWKFVPSFRSCRLLDFICLRPSNVKIYLYLYRFRTLRAMYFGRFAFIRPTCNRGTVLENCRSTTIYISFNCINLVLRYDVSGVRYNNDLFTIYVSLNQDPCTSMMYNDRTSLSVL